MNQSTKELIAVAAKNGFKHDKQSPYAGRYRLSGDQVLPNYRPSYDVYLRLRRKTASMVAEMLDEADWPVAGLLRVLDDSHIANAMWSIDYPFSADTYLLSFCQISDACYVGEENIYAGIESIAPYVEDGHFFIYSTGDGDDRWIHEYQITDGTLEFNRHILDEEMYVGRIEFYLSLNYSSREWKCFVREQVDDMAKRVAKPIAAQWRKRTR